MKQQFKGPITLDIAARTVTLHDIQLTPDRVLLVVNATVGYVYHNFSIDDPAVITTVVRASATSTEWPDMVDGTDTVIHFSAYKDCDTHQNSDAISVFYEDGVDLGKLIKDESDETQVQLTAFQTEVKAESDATQTLLQTEFDETQTLLTAFQTEVKAESDATQTLLQTEFDETQTLLTAFQTEVKSESDATQTLLQTEFDETQTLLTAFQAEVKSESDATQTLLQTEFDQTQTQLAAFQTEVKAESDETQAILNSRLAVLVDGKYPVLSLDTFSPANGYTVNITNGVYGPTVMEFVRTGVVGLRLFLTYDANGQVTSITPV